MAMELTSSGSTSCSTTGVSATAIQSILEYNATNELDDELSTWHLCRDVVMPFVKKFEEDGCAYVQCHSDLLEENMGPETGDSSVFVSHGGWGRDHLVVT